MSKSLLGLILAVFAALSLRAEQPIFTLSTIEATPGQIIDVDIRVDDFTQILSVSFSVNWNADVLQFRAIKNLNPSVPGLMPSAFATPQDLGDPGKLSLVWLEPSVTPVTIPDGSLFFTVEFEVIGEPCQSTSVAITDNPTEIEVIEAGEVEVGLVAHNGSVSIPGSGCVEDIQFIGNSIIGACGGNACIQFTVENFDAVVAMEFSLVYNPAILQFTEFRNFAPLQGFGSGNTNLFAPGTLRVVWINSNVEDESLPDGTILFEICFNVIGTGGQSSQITFGNDPTVMLSDTAGNLYNVNIIPAEITAQCQLEGFALIADTVCTMPGGITCIDVKVNDFEDIIALQFSMNWDSTVFEFDHVECFGIPGLDATGFGVPGNPDVREGQLTISWIDLSLEGVTVPDFSTLFCVCLKAVGAAGTSTSFSFTNTPIDIEILNADEEEPEFALLHGLAQVRTSCEGCSDLSYTLVATSPDCPREATGSLNLTVIEDCPENPTFLWSPGGATTEDLFNIAAGTYTVTITLTRPQGTQIVIASATVVDPDPISVDGTVIDPNPPGSSTGSIDITVSGGMPPYAYQWSDPPGGNSQDISNLAPGSYSVTVTDSKGCTFIPDPFVVGADLSGTVSNVLPCHGGSTGSIILTVSFGTGPYTYLWNTTPAQTTKDISNLPAGQYCVTVTDNTGSTRDACFTITQPGALVVTATLVHDVNQNCQGAIDLNVIGGAMPYSYIWSNGATTQDITGLCPNQYCVTVTDGNGCTMTSCFTIAIDPLSIQLVATQYGSFQISCNGICDGEITSVVQGGGPNLSYAWSNNATIADLSNLCAGTYTLTVTDPSAGTATATIVLTAPNPFALNFITTNPSDFITSDGAISVVVNGGTPPYTYQWTGPVPGNTASLNNIPAGTYTVRITDANGCEIIRSFSLLPADGGDCYSGMRVITPNEDGKNDFFIIACVLDLDNRLYIFNRLGGLVYETANYQNTWDGVDQDNEPVPDGGYLWILEVTRPDSSKQLIKGTVTVLRTAD